MSAIVDKYFRATVRWMMDNDILDFKKIMGKANEVSEKVRIMEESGIPVPPPTSDIIASFFK